MPSRGLVMSPNNRKQAYVPEGAVIFNNDVGTAPGMAIETNGDKDFNPAATDRLKKPSSSLKMR